MKIIESKWFPLVLLLAGFFLRLWMASAFFINADEALHYLLSTEPTLGMVYQASLSTAHPPLYLVLLHYWRSLGDSEIVLRLPSVLAATGFSGLAYLWLRRTLGRDVALMGLVLLLFCPPLIWLSWEIRQYAIMWFFGMGSLYFFERGADDSSAPLIALSALLLWLALLMHYSALLFAASLGVYGILRLWQTKSRSAVVAIWVAGQAAALALVAFLFKTHITKLRSTPLPLVHQKAMTLPQDMMDSYLRRSIFHPSDESLLRFIGKSNIRFFHYLFAQEAVGVVGLLLFVAGLVILARTGAADPQSRAHRRAIAALLALPFVMNCITAIAGLYPYGGTRHDSYLALFAAAGIAVPLASWKMQTWRTLFVLGVVLVICNLFPAATGEYIRPRDQKRRLMTEATALLRQSAPPGSIIFTDDQGRLLLTYYLCRENRIPYQIGDQFVESSCGGYRLIGLSPYLWIFKADEFPDDVHEVRQTFGLEPDTRVWFFQAGWLIDKVGNVQPLLPQFGCSEPRKFGRNIIECPMVLADGKVNTATQ